MLQALQAHKVWGSIKVQPCKDTGVRIKKLDGLLCLVAFLLLVYQGIFLQGGLMK